MKHTRWGTWSTKEHTRNKRTVSSLCTRNYYRSRFAEIIFNIHAREYGIPREAVSRGDAVDLGVNNAGPFSRAVLSGPEERGIPIPGEPPCPTGLTYHELTGADLIIALNEREHRPLMNQ